MKNVIFSLTSLFIISCATTDTSLLPKEMPSDFSIEVHRDGGMSPLGETYKIFGDSASVTFSNRGNRRHYSVALHKDTLDGIYQLLRTQNYDQIVVREEEEVYDRGGYSIEVMANDQSIDISDAQRSFVVKEYQQNFSTIVEAVMATISRALEPSKVKVTVVIDDSVYQLGLLVFGTERDEISYNYNTDSLQNKAYSFDVLPGQYEFDAYVLDPVGESWDLKRLTDVRADLQIVQETTIELSIQGDTLTYRNNE